MSKSHTNANTPLFAWGLPPSTGLNDIIGCQGYKDTACRERGGRGIGRAIHIAWKGKQEAGILGIKKKRSLVETSIEDSKGNRAWPGRGKAGEKNACQRVLAHIRSLLFLTSHCTFFLCLEKCNIVQLLLEVKEQQLLYQRDRGKIWFETVKPCCLVHLCTNWLWYFLSLSTVCVSVCVYLPACRGWACLFKGIWNCKGLLSFYSWPTASLNLDHGVGLPLFFQHSLQGKPHMDAYTHPPHTHSF